MEESDNFRWLAHISEDGREQTIKEHLLGTAELCSKFADVFQSAEMGYITGALHDIGKFSNSFQKRILENGPRVDHASAGMYESARLNNILSAFCISGHHGGLPDGGGRADIDKPTLMARLNKVKNKKIPDYTAWKGAGIRAEKPQLPEFCKDPINASFYIRMLFSCLVDADFLDTETFMNGGVMRRRSNVSMTSLNERLDNYIEGWFPPRGELNAVRCEILKQCIAAGKSSSRGIFSLSVPTGGGKTVASLAFALQQAKALGMSRVIYVIPYTSIIEQTAQIFRDILGNECVLEHHADVDFSESETSEIRHTDEILFRATENWDIPVVVTTSVRFFESLYANKPSACRKLHNIANSVIIFDEAQMLPLSYLRPCVCVMTQLVKYYFASVVLCTATQPALGRLIQGFFPECSITEICPSSLYHSPVFKRVCFQKLENITYESLSEILNEHEQVLCIVNSRKNAQKVYDSINPEGSFHLSTLMTPSHRKRQLKEIRRRLSKGQTCRVVSTSLIEAGVDVDFPAVFRELAGLDSILQAAGRCNREGKLPSEESVVTVFCTTEKIPPTFSAQAEVTKMVFEKFADFSSPEAIAFYFNELRSLKGESAQDSKRVLKQLAEDFFPFRTISDNFHLIENNTATVFIPFGEGGSLLNRYRAGERSRELFREMGRFSINVYEQHLNALLEAGDIYQLGDSKMYELVNMNLYSEHKGLSLKADFGKALFI